MTILTYLTHIATVIVFGYIGLAHSFVAELTQFFEFPNHEETAVVENNTTESPLQSLIETTERIAANLQKTLLNNADFQRAALYASRLDEAQPNIDKKDADEALEDALVNIYCQYKTDEYMRTTTGTGFFINEKGIILTNAHVAQFLLLENTKGSVRDVDCVIRSGNPAKAQYKAELLYISPTWVFENAKLITEESPRGTGERDYALLYVSKSIDTTPLPTSFPAVPVDTALLSRAILDTPILTAGYPAEGLMRYGADAALKPVLASTHVSTLYTFGSNYADVFSVSESAVGEQGASGGPIMHTDAKTVIGLIVTKGDESTEGAHSLRALTLSYIDRTIKEETGYTLIENMRGDPALRGNIFKKAMVPFLAGLLQDEISAAQ